MVRLEIVVMGENREKAWKTARRVCDVILDSNANVHSIPQEPLPDPEKWIAINEYCPRCRTKIREGICPKCKFKW